MTLPTYRGPHDLPVGIQLVAQRYDDDRLFACARWIWTRSARRLCCMAGCDIFTVVARSLDPRVPIGDHGLAGQGEPHESP